MHNFKDDAEEPRVFNVLQIVALSFVTTAGAVIAYSSAGAPLGASLLAGCATGPFLTMAITMTAAWTKDTRQRSKSLVGRTGTSDDLSKGPPLVDGPISTIEELWNSDRLLEMEFAREQNPPAITRRTRRAKPSDFVAMWEADAALDAAAGKVAPKRPVRADRRQNPKDIEQDAEKRRAARG